MGVTFTANVALAKPDDTELAANWARFTQLADDNNVIVAANASIVLSSTTPAVIAATTAPNLGVAPTQVIEYINFRNMIFGSFNIQAGATGVSAGTGAYGIALPFTVDNVFHSVGTTLNDTIGTLSCLGEGYLYDDSAVAGSTTAAVDAVTIAGVSYLRLIPEAIAGKASAIFGSASPFVFAANDGFSGTFCYKKT